MNEVLSLPRTDAWEATERAGDLPVVRPPDCPCPRTELAAPVISMLSAMAEKQAKGMERWIDPATGRVWGSPPSHVLRDLALQAVKDEQIERAARMSYEESLRAASQQNHMEWAPHEKSLEL